jgi:hypothetical protein
MNHPYVEKLILKSKNNFSKYFTFFNFIDSSEFRKENIRLLIFFWTKELFLKYFSMLKTKEWTNKIQDAIRNSNCWPRVWRRSTKSNDKKVSSNTRDVITINMAVLFNCFLKYANCLANLIRLWNAGKNVSTGLPRYSR